MIQLANVFCVQCKIVTIVFDYNKRLILFSVIQLTVKLSKNTVMLLNTLTYQDLTVGKLLDSRPDELSKMKLVNWTE